MIRKRISTLLPTLLLLTVFNVGCRPNSPATGIKPPTPSAPSPQAGAQVTSPPTTPVVSDTPIKDAVEKLLAEQNASEHPFLPRGTRLLSAAFKDGVASLDFSKEFATLANHGDTVESKAQKALRHALADIHGVEKMRVTVEGQPFDSQATDWNTPFPVHDDADTDSTGLNASARSDDRP
jgi:hypothetical protein